MRMIRTLALAAPIVIGAAGCQNDNDFRGAAVPPIAVIQPISSGPASDLFTFEVDGRESYDPNRVDQDGNGIYEFEWSIESTPAGAIASIDGWGTADFVTDTPGNYGIGLRVRDINDFVWSEKVVRTLHAFPVSGLAATLTWNTDVNDVDLHLIQDTQGGDLFDDELDCHFQNLRPDWVPEGSTDGDPSLNHDEVDGMGPETVEMGVPTIGEQYRVLVHYFSDDGFSDSDAKVKIFVNGAEVAEMERNLLANQVWDLGIFDWTGASGSFQMTDTLSEY
jgi:hypothetical protein